MFWKLWDCGCQTNDRYMVGQPVSVFSFFSGNKNRLQQKTQETIKKRLASFDGLSKHVKSFKRLSRVRLFFSLWRLLLEALLCQLHTRRHTAEHGIEHDPYNDNTTALFQRQNKGSLFVRIRAKVVPLPLPQLLFFVCYVLFLTVITQVWGALFYPKYEHQKRGCTLYLGKRFDLEFFQTFYERSRTFFPKSCRFLPLFNADWPQVHRVWTWSSYPDMFRMNSKFAWTINEFIKSKVGVRLIHGYIRKYQIWSAKVRVCLILGCVLYLGDYGIYFGNTHQRSHISFESPC